MFLAKTAVEEFWDKSQKIVFLGEWCKLYSRKKEWQDLEYKTAPFIWTNTDAVLSGMKYCDSVYEKTLVEITKTLNNYHRLNKDTLFYRIILGVWAFHFIHQLYDKFLNLTQVFENYPDVETLLLDEKQFYSPLDTWDAINKITKNDKYSLQLYSQILTALGYNFKRKSLVDPINQPLIYRTRPSTTYKRYILSSILKILSFVSRSFHKQTITLTHHGIASTRDLLRLLLESRFKCINDEMRYKIVIHFKCDEDFRNTPLNMKSDVFESILSKILLANIPVLFLEGFSAFKKAVLNLPIVKSKAFFGAICNNNIYYYYVAEHRQKIKIMDMQHGGNYGTDLLHSYEEHEKVIGDRFYTSGWQKGKNTVPFLISKYVKKIAQTPATETILIGVNEMPRYVYRLHFQAIATNYLQEALRQLSTFLEHSKWRKNMLIRTCPQGEYGWDTNERLENEFKDCCFDDLSESFDQRLAEAKIYVSHGIYTTYIEALVVNKPTIIILSDKIYRFHADAQPYFDHLQQVKILHYSAKDAAEHLNSIYNKAQSWWQKENVQAARLNFIKKYARTSSNWIKEWNSEFNRVLKS